MDNLKRPKELEFMYKIEGNINHEELVEMLEKIQLVCNPKWYRIRKGGGRPYRGQESPEAQIIIDRIRETEDAKMIISGRNLQVFAIRTEDIEKCVQYIASAINLLDKRAELKLTNVEKHERHHLSLTKGLISPLEDNKTERLNQKIDYLEKRIIALERWRKKIQEQIMTDLLAFHKLKSLEEKVKPDLNTLNIDSKITGASNVLMKKTARFSKDAENQC